MEPGGSVVGEGDDLRPLSEPQRLAEGWRLARTRSSLCPCATLDGLGLPSPSTLRALAALGQPLPSRFTRSPIQPVERETAPTIIEEKETEVIELTMDNALKPNNGPDEPDWELVQKMSKLDKPAEGIPEAPDLDRLSEEE